MSVIRKKVTDEGMVGWCHNKKCELYPYSYQGACHLYGQYFKCCICNKLLHTEEPKNVPTNYSKLKKIFLDS